MVIGYFIVAAEPAVHVLNRQVEELTSGNITAREMQIGLSGGRRALGRPGDDAHPDGHLDSCGC